MILCCGKTGGLKVMTNAPFLILDFHTILWQQGYTGRIPSLTSCCMVLRSFCDVHYLCLYKFFRYRLAICELGKTAVQHNTDISIDLKPWRLVAVNHLEWVGSVPQIVTIVMILTETPEVEVAWMEHERSFKKVTWLPSFWQSQLPRTTTILDNILLLYNFRLNPRGQTLHEKKTIYSELREGEWNCVGHSTQSQCNTSISIKLIKKLLKTPSE